MNRALRVLRTCITKRLIDGRAVMLAESADRRARARNSPIVGQQIQQTCETSRHSGGLPWLIRGGATMGPATSVAGGGTYESR